MCLRRYSLSNRISRSSMNAVHCALFFFNIFLIYVWSLLLVNYSFMGNRVFSYNEYDPSKATGFQYRHWKAQYWERMACDDIIFSTMSSVVNCHTIFLSDVLCISSDKCDSEWLNDLLNELSEISLELIFNFSSTYLDHQINIHFMSQSLVNHFLFSSSTVLFDFIVLTPSYPPPPLSA